HEFAGQGEDGAFNGHEQRDQGIASGIQRVHIPVNQLGEHEVSDTFISLVGKASCCFLGIWKESALQVLRNPNGLPARAEAVETALAFPSTIITGLKPGANETEGRGDEISALAPNAIAR